MTEPQITIGITAFNERKWLLEAWESVQNQTDSRWEAIMILDGGATKKTINYFNSINHPQLTKIKFTENVGPYLARTKAIQYAKTNWYFHLDGDDKLPENSIYRLLKKIEANPDVDFIYGQTIHFNKKNRKVVPSFWDLELLPKFLTILATSPFKTEIFDNLDGYSKDLVRGGADWDFWIGVAEAGYKGLNIDDIIYERRQHKNNVGSNWPYTREFVAKTMIKRHPEFFKKNDRIKNCLASAYEFMARHYSSKGNRYLANEYAIKSIEYGINNRMMQKISEEYKMSFFRYKLRRISHFWTTLIKKIKI